MRSVMDVFPESPQRVATELHLPELSEVETAETRLEVTAGLMSRRGIDDFYTRRPIVATGDGKSQRPQVR